MATTNLGRVRFNMRGDYNPAADPLYSLLDLVSDGGGSFVYINDTPSNEPTSSASHWQQIASQGTKGDAGGTWTKGEDIPLQSGGTVGGKLTEIANDFDEAVGAVTVDSEVILARGGKTILGDRLDEVDSQLAAITNYRRRAETSIRSKLMAHPAKTILGDFEDAESWTVGYVSEGSTCELDATRAFSGKKSVKVVIAPAGIATISKSISSTDFTGKEVGVMGYFLERSPSVSTTFRTAPDGGVTPVQWEVAYNPPIANKWYNMDYIPPSGATLTGQNWICVHAKNTGATTQTLWLDYITINAKPSYFTGGAVSFIFDGSYASAFANGKPILDAYNYKGMATIASGLLNDGARATLAQLKQAQASGWDVGPHSTDDAVTTIGGVAVDTSLGLIYPKIMANLDWLDENGFRKGSRFLVYYQGVYTEITSDIVEDYLGGIGRGATAGYNSFLQHDAINLRGTMIYANKADATLTGMIDRAKAQNHWLVFFVHKVDATAVNPANDTSIAQFQAIVDYVAAQGLKVVTLSQMYDDILFKA